MRTTRFMINLRQEAQNRKICRPNNSKDFVQICISCNQLIKEAQITLALFSYYLTAYMCNLLRIYNFNL